MIVLVALLRRGSCVRIATESHKGAVSLSGVQLFLWKYLKRIHLKAGLWKRSGQRKNLRDS